MRGALTFIFMLGSSLCMPALSGAQSGPLSSNAPETLDQSFDAASQRVQNQLLNAPEASYLYLEHWIGVYNQTNPGERPFTFEKQIDPAAPAARDYEVPRKKTDWRPNGFPIVSPSWRYATPVSFTPASRFRPPPPPTIDSEAYAQDAKDVLSYGDLHSHIRTPEESLTSAFWANGPGTETPPGRWNMIALESSKHVPRAQRAELMLMLNIALYDAGIAAFDAKYHYDYWRPQTAIHQLDPEYTDWEPMMQPPFHPEYVSGHSAFSGAAAAVLEHYLGNMEFCITAPELLGLERCYNTFTQAANEAGRSRIFGGIHFEFSNQAGLTLGREVAQHVMATIKLSEN